MKNLKKLLIPLIIIISVILSLNIAALAENSTEAEIFDSSRLGDVNGDNLLTAADARLLLRCSAKLEKITDEILFYGDFDKDGDITVTDARTSLRLGASLENIECYRNGHIVTEEYIVAATCTEIGYTTKKCVNCYYTDGSKKDYTPKIPHNYTRQLYPATCTEKGRHDSVCTLCGYVGRTEELPLTTHKYEKKVTAATCTENGKNDSVCSHCGYVGRETAIPATGHKFTEWKYSNLAKTRFCTVCGYEDKVKSKSDKVVYLTFDDGPGPNTERLLGYLKQYDVKATFFVTNQNSAYKHLYKKIVADGHAIGVHTYTHSWSIYSSEKSYMNDFNKMHDLIYKETGVDTKIFRFPGGTNNTVSRSYSKGIMAKMVKKLTDEGYVYFDWNVDCRDTQGYSASEIARTTINQIKGKKTSIVLMHDTKRNTVNAIKTIIEYGLKNGYTFSVLDETSPKVQFRPVN